MEPYLRAINANNKRNTIKNNQLRRTKKTVQVLSIDQIELVHNLNQNQKLTSEWNTAIEQIESCKGIVQDMTYRSNEKASQRDY